MPRSTVVAQPPTDASLPDLAAAAAGCEACELYADATQTVFGEGPATARVVMVGEQPGDKEDRAGQPFVGPAGRELDRALAEAGIDRSQVYVTNAVKHFAFTRRGSARIHQTPRAPHIHACRPWVAAELDNVAPEIVVCLGATAAKSIIGNDIRVLRDRGLLLERAGMISDGPFVVTVHPSSILRVPAEDRERAHQAFVSDLRTVAALLGS